MDASASQPTRTASRNDTLRSEVIAPLLGSRPEPKPRPRAKAKGARRLQTPDRGFEICHLKGHSTQSQECLGPRNWRPGQMLHSHGSSKSSRTCWQPVEANPPALTKKSNAWLHVQWTVWELLHTGAVQNMVRRARYSHKTIPSLTVPVYTCICTHCVIVCVCVNLRLQWQGGHGGPPPKKTNTHVLRQLSRSNGREKAAHNSRRYLPDACRTDILPPCCCQVYDHEACVMTCGDTSNPGGDLVERSNPEADGDSLLLMLLL